MSTITEKPTVYIGPERRTEDRRRRQSPLYGEAIATNALPERRSGSDRRQRALAGVVVGLSAEDMLALREVWELTEQ